MPNIEPASVKPLGMKLQNTGPLGRLTDRTGETQNWSGIYSKGILKPLSQRKPDMYWAVRSEVYNNTRQHPGEDICSLAQMIKAMAAMCAWKEQRMCSRDSDASDHLL